MVNETLNLMLEQCNSGLLQCESVSSGLVLIAAFLFFVGGGAVLWVLFGSWFMDKYYMSFRKGYVEDLVDTHDTLVDEVRFLSEQVSKKKEVEVNGVFENV